MTNERQGRIRQLFDAALDQPAQIRRQFLAGACAGDQHLLEMLEKLLAANERGAGILDTPIHQRHDVSVEPRQPGSYIGPYKILQELSGGGMGIVYQALRADEVFQRVCAIKVIRAELSTPWLLDRFRQERQILGRLDHPNIARILDGGSTADNLPYFVMDYVDGPALNKFCFQHELSIRQRLALYRQACLAVAYLHQNGVIHGDLKPPNILVGNDGTVKLVDFGIATVLSTAEKRERAHALPLMTPGYASPEQLRGDPLTAASDVYSLGVVLYELLTGVQPFPAGGKSRSEILEQIASQDPVPPSFVLSKTAREPISAKALKGDLDCIAIHAMHRLPQNRYGSVAQLTEDIDRYLGNRPIAARPSGPLRRGWMFFQRNELATVVVLLIAILVGALAWEGLELYRSYVLAVRIENQIHDLQEAWTREMEDLQQNPSTSAGGAAAASDLLADQLSDAAKLADAYRTSFPEAVRVWPGMTSKRRNLIQNANKALHEAEPLLGDDQQGAQQLAKAWLWLANLQGNPKTVNLHDRQGALTSIEEAMRLLKKLPNAPPDLTNQIENAAAQIQSSRK